MKTLNALQGKYEFIEGGRMRCVFLLKGFTQMLKIVDVFIINEATFDAYKIT
jgi:hypothetical protein